MSLSRDRRYNRLHCPHSGREIGVWGRELVDTLYLPLKENLLLVTSSGQKELLDGLAAFSTAKD